jgi:hypothetical protein
VDSLVAEMIPERAAEYVTATASEVGGERRF